jgi:chemotaxis protein methyltransferase CheR
MVNIDQADFRIWAKYIYDISGIFLEPAKAYLVESRLNPLLNEYGCKTFIELYHKAKTDASKSIEKNILDQITTNETLFFRDRLPFEMLKYKILPDLIDRRMAKPVSGLPIAIRIWSVGCSTGQEVYSIAIALKELLIDLSKYSIRILGTDISSAALARASYGMYNKFEIDRGLTPDRLERYFIRQGDTWKIKDEIRIMVTFKKINLMLPFTGLGKFDVVFCRNVAIYFTPEDRKKLFYKIEQVLEANGYLIIGSTESLTSIYPQFEPKRYLRSVFYQVRNS